MNTLEWETRKPVAGVPSPNKTPRPHQLALREQLERDRAPSVAGRVSDRLPRVEKLTKPLLLPRG